MQVKIKVNNEITQLEQFSNQLNIPINNNSLQIPTSIGNGFIKQFQLPYNIIIHHYYYNMQQAIVVKSENLEKNGLYMIQVNLSNRVLNKEVGGAEKNLSFQGKCGALFYSPGHNSKGGSEIGKQFEMVFFTMPKETYHNIINKESNKKINPSNFCLYTELSKDLEASLREVISKESSYSLLILNGKLLEILDRILNTFQNREFLPTSKLKMNDVEKLFGIKRILEENIYSQLPTIKQLAQTVAMSETKLKTDFKSLFGTSIYKYYLLLKMEVGKQLIESRAGTISEISFRLGYSNPAQFSAQFRKHYGVAPSKI